MLWVAGRSPTLVSHSEAWPSHESSGDNLNLPSYISSSCMINKQKLPGTEDGGSTLVTPCAKHI